jgi:hypothetical protein
MKITLMRRSKVPKNCVSAQPPAPKTFGCALQWQRRCAHIDRDLVVALRPEAARRQTTVPALINHLLAVTVEDRLTTAILDD